MESTQIQADPKIIAGIDSTNRQAWTINRSEPRNAFELAETALRQSIDAAYLKGEGLALRTLGNCHVWLGRYNEGLTTSFNAAEKLKSAGLPDEVGQVYYNLGTNFYYMADYDHSLKYFLESYRTYVDTGNLPGQADARNGMGTVYYTIGENEKALECLLFAKNVCEKTGASEILQKVLDGLGSTYTNLGEYQKALECMYLCLDLIRQRGGSQQVEAFAMNGIGTIYFKLGDNDRALEFYEKTLVIRKNIGFLIGEATTLTHMGKVHISNKNFDKAEKCLQDALIVATETQSKEWIYQSAQELSVLYEKAGDFDKALKFYKLYHSTGEDVRNEKAENRSRGIEMQLRMEQVETEKELLRQQKEELERYYKDMVLLSDIGKKITSSLSAEYIISTVYKSINQLMDAPCFGIGVVDEETNRIVFPGYIEKGERLDSEGFSMDDKERLAIRCYHNQEEIVINNIGVDILRYTNKVPEVLVGERTESLIYLPVTYRNKKLGVITVQSFNPNAYKVYQINIVRNLAVYAAIALENASMYKSVEDEVKIRTEEIESQKRAVEKSFHTTRLLSEIGQQLTSKTRFDEIFRELHGNVNQLMDAGCFGVRIYHPGKQMVEYKYEIENDHRHEVSWISMDDDDNYSVWCIKNRKEIFINDNLKEYGKYVKQIRVVSGDMPHSLIFYPLLIAGKVLGVITIQSFQRNAYEPHHLDVVKTLASYTAIALDNAYLYENLEHKVVERTSEVIRQKEIIEEKNKHITDSIRYAKRIQEAILPPGKLVKSFFSDSFVLYKPKDIVSGDFYWMEAAGDKILFSVVDCTGHGVPGAFMSIMGHSQLSRAVNEHHLLEPAAILNYLNRSITEALLRQGDQAVRDGMDLALCSLDTKTLKLQYAGAYNPLYLVNKKGLKEIKGDKIAIGSWTEGQADYINHEVQLTAGDSLYIFSDGYADQFGGLKGKKYMTRNFKNLILGLRDMPMNLQMETLNANLEQWRGEFEQVDDICVIGVRV